MSEQRTLAEVMRAHSFIRMTCYDHDGPCCPEGCHDVAESQYEHYERVILAHLASEQVKVREERDSPAVLYHWSPSRNRESIEREGLRPGSQSNIVPKWCPPHVCYGETPSAALGLTLLDDALDLWMVRADGHRFTLANEGAEWRSTEHIEAWYVATRPRAALAAQREALERDTL